MKRFKVYPELTSYYYSTLSITAWLPVFQDDCYFRIIIDSFQYCRENKGLFLLGYVIMPTHLHLITSNDDNTTLPEIMDEWLNQKIDYAHYNPVRKGFVETPEQWKYSSARNWLNNDDSIIDVDRHCLG